MVGLSGCPQQNPRVQRQGLTAARVWLLLQAKADERTAALERENVVLRVQAADSAKRAEELQQQLSACQVMQPFLLRLRHMPRKDRIHEDLVGR